MTALRDRRAQALAGLFAVLLGVLLLLAPPGQQRLPPLAVYSSEPRGGKALRLWLDALGYRLSTLEESSYTMPRLNATLLILAPTTPFERHELDQLARWVRQGGRLVVVGDGFQVGSLLERFDLRSRPLAQRLESAGPLQAELLDPLLDQVVVKAQDELILPEGNARPILGSGEQVIGAEVAYGAGQVVVLLAPYALSNEALRRTDNARLALSLVGPSNRGPLVIDELHHGYGATDEDSLWSLLLERAWGQAALAAGVVLLVFLIFYGRRFGRAVPVSVSRGRSLAEYVTSLAALYRVGGKRRFAAEHFRQRLRHDIAEQLGLSARATDGEIEAAARALGRDPVPIHRALGSFGGSSTPSEADLLKAVREAEQVLADLARREVRA